MTDAEKKSLTGHLAEKVCGWKLAMRQGEPTWVSDDWKTIQRVQVSFDPLSDPRDTALVMEAWQKQGFGLSIDMDSNATLRPWTATTNYGDVEGACSEAYETMAEAVCVTIGRASGWDGERS